MSAPPVRRARPVRTVAVVSIAAYVGLGLPGGALGVAWPSMREDFGQPLAALGLVLIAFTVGYLVLAVVHGRLAHRIGTGTQAAAAAALCACGIAAIAGAPLWWVVLAGSVVQGAASADIDAELNAYVAVHHESRLLHFMHGGFGIGATLGPIVVTAGLSLHLSWRVVFALIALWWAGVALAFAWHRTSFEVPDLSRVDAPRVSAGTADLAEPLGSRRLTLVIGLSLGTFFLYNGLELAVGSWAYTYLLADGFGEGAAGLATTAYWAALMVGRLGLGALGHRAAPRGVLWLSMAVTPLATMMIVPGGPVAVAGLVLLGVALAGVFPSLVALTPHRLGPARSRRVMGLQFGAAVVGAAALSAAVGVVAERRGEAAIAPALVAGALAMVACYLALTYWARRSDPHALD